MEESDKSIIMYGNVVDGMQFIGPFDTSHEAGCYAEISLPHEEWWVAPITSPSDEDDSEEHGDLKEALSKFTKRWVPGCCDVNFYNKDEWKERGEDMWRHADLTMTFEGGFYTEWNHDGQPEMYKEFARIVSELGYTYEQGFMWSLHFFKEKR